MIRDQSGQVVSMVESSQSLPLFAEIVNNSFNSIRPQFAVNQTSDIKVEFTINAHNSASLLQQSLFIVVLISGLIALLPIIYMKSMFRRLNRKISTTISDIVDIYINQNQVNGDLEQAMDTTRLKKLSKDLIPSFNRLSHFLQTKHDDIQNNALNIKKEAYKDVVTNLGNRNMFVEYYEKNIENAEKSTFGSLAMVRCSELQTINQTRGYQKR